MEIVSMPPEIQDNSINYREISQIIRELIFLSQTLKSDWNKISEKSSFNLSRHLTSFYHDAIFPRSEPDDVVPIASYFIHEIRSPNRARNHRVHRSTRLVIIRESLLDHSNSRSGTDPSPPEKVYRSLIAVSRWNYIYERSRCDRISSEESGSFVRNRLPVLLLSLEMNRNRKCRASVGLPFNFFRGTIEKTRGSKKEKKFANAVSISSIDR